jgi:hypothetical protein
MTELYKDCVFYKLSRMRMYEFHSEADLAKIIAEVLESSDTELLKTHGSDYFQEYRDDIDDSDGDNINSWRDHFAIDICPENEDSVLLLFQEESNRDAMWDLFTTPSP